MIKNYYYLIVGVLSILFAFTHAWNGQAAVLPTLDVKNIDANTRTVFFYVWHIITIENLVFGASFFFMAFYKDLSKVRFAVWMIVIIMIARWAVIFGSTLFINKIKPAEILMDTVAILVVISLMVLGTRVKNKVSK